MSNWSWKRFWQGFREGLALPAMWFVWLWKALRTPTDKENT